MSPELQGSARRFATSLPAAMVLRAVTAICAAFPPVFRRGCVAPILHRNGRQGAAMTEPASVPENERERLVALRSYRILDTGPEERFDRLTRLAARLFGKEIALVSLVDEARQWFKSRHGIDTPEMPREIALCAHAILTDGVMVVEDASADPRFADNPLVRSSPNIRFYAGAPLIDRDG